MTNGMITEDWPDKNKVLVAKLTAALKGSQAEVEMYKSKILDLQNLAGSLREELAAAREELRLAGISTRHLCDGMSVEIVRLKANLESAVKVIEFYADSYTWVSNSGKVGINPINYDNENIPTDRADHRWCGGKTARRFLSGLKTKGE